MSYTPLKVFKKSFSNQKCFHESRHFEMSRKNNNELQGRKYGSSCVQWLFKESLNQANDIGVSEMHV